MKHVLPSLVLCLTLAGCDEKKPQAASAPTPPPGTAGGATVAKQASGDPTPGQDRSIVEHSQRMDWWRRARFGMFIHWGVYSVPAGTWNGKTTGGPSEWIMQSLKVPTSTYERFAEDFTAKNYDPEAWAALAKRAGMKYIVITSRHHDGFCLWDSPTTQWDITAAPAARDLLAPLAKAAREQGLKFCTYYSIKDWRHPDYLPARAWNDNPKWNGGPGYVPDFEGRFVPYVHAQVEEIIKKYQPSVMWFDGEWEDTWTAAHGDALLTKVRSLKPDIIVNNRVGKSRNDMQGMTKPGVKAQGDFCTPEQEIPSTGFPGVDWETCMTMNSSWGFKAGDDRWKSAAEMVRMLCDIASKGGNFLMNVGPTADGRIPQESIDRLEEIGKWMSLNGEAIYDTTASPFKKLAWGRATVKDNALYLLVFDWPKDGQLQLPGLNNAVSSARVITLDKMMRHLKTETTDLGVTISNLGSRPAGMGSEQMPAVIRVELDGPPKVATPAPTPIAHDARGNYRLDAAAAETIGPHIKLQGEGASENLGFWTSADDKAVWTIAPLAPGEYRAEIELSCQPGDAGNTFELICGDAAARATVPSTGSWTKFTVVSVSPLKVTAQPAGPSTLQVGVAPGTTLKGGLMNLRQIRLIRIR